MCLSLDREYKLASRWVDAILWQQLREPTLMNEFEKQLPPVAVAGSSPELKPHCVVGGGRGAGRGGGRD